MFTAFLSYCHQDRKYAPLLKRMLEFHRVATWLDQDTIEPGANYREALEGAMGSVDCLLVAVTECAVRSKWVTREIATFNAVGPGRRIIPLIFEDVHLDDVFDGLGSYQSISFRDDLDLGFAHLIGKVFGVPYLQAPERRSAVSDRRVTERRHHDRRAAGVEQRLRIGMWKQFAAATGRGEYEEFGVEGNDDPLDHDVVPSTVPTARWTASPPIPQQSRGRDRTRAIFRLADMFAAEDSELAHYTFTEASTGTIVPVTAELLAELAHRALRELEPHGKPYNVYVVEKVTFALLGRFVVAPADRRRGPRRTGEDRRPVS